MIPCKEGQKDDDQTDLDPIQTEKHALESPWLTRV